jgi:hypothetical protein
MAGERACWRAAGASKGALRGLSIGDVQVRRCDHDVRVPKAALQANRRFSADASA